MSESIDVLLPVFARVDQAMLAAAVASVFAQHHCAQTLWLLINGGSVDERHQLAAFAEQLVPPDHPTTLQLVCLEQAGITSALNLGLELSTADWLARLDSDDRMAPSRLQRVVEHVQWCRRTGAPVPDVIGTAMAVLDGESQQPTGLLLRRPCQDRAIRRYLCWGNPFLHPSVQFRRQLLQRVGGYRAVPQAEDLDLWLRLSRMRGVHFANLSEPLTLYSLCEGSLSHQRDSFLQSALCRLRHADTSGRALLFMPKILFDLLRYGQRWITTRSAA